MEYGPSNKTPNRYDSLLLAISNHQCCLSWKFFIVVVKHVFLFWSNASMTKYPVYIIFIAFGSDSESYRRKGNWCYTVFYAQVYNFFIQRLLCWEFKLVSQDFAWKSLCLLLLLDIVGSEFKLVFRLIQNYRLLAGNQGLLKNYLETKLESGRAFPSGFGSASGWFRVLIHPLRIGICWQIMVYVSLLYLFAPFTFNQPSRFRFFRTFFKFVYFISC